MKSICITGLGQFGSHLAQYLPKQGVQVFAVDLRQDNVNTISDTVIEPHHIMTVVGKDEHTNALVERSTT
ncbi:MAG: NAD-binding protein [Holophagae bacterium]|nr:NAD-binding protein [Holophagae bacterium]